MLNDMISPTNKYLYKIQQYKSTTLYNSIIKHFDLENYISMNDNLYMYYVLHDLEDIHFLKSSFVNQWIRKQPGEIDSQSMWTIKVLLNNWHFMKLEYNFKTRSVSANDMFVGQFKIFFFKGRDQREWRRRVCIS